MSPELLQQARAARAAVASGRLRGPALLAQLRALPFDERDAWVDEVLGLEAAPPDAPDLPRGAVPYLPCGVDEVIAMVLEAPVTAGDTFVDLGSGLGRAVLLAHLLSGAHAKGIELQAQLVHRARARAEELGLTGVELVHGDATATPLDGSVFFLYAPFNGELLERAVARLAEVAARREIVIGAVGLELAGVPWLRPRSTSSASLMLYASLI